MIGAQRSSLWHRPPLQADEEPVELQRVANLDKPDRCADKQ